MGFFCLWPELLNENFTFSSGISPYLLVTCSLLRKSKVKEKKRKKTGKAWIWQRMGKDEDWRGLSFFSPLREFSS